MEKDRIAIHVFRVLISIIICIKHGEWNPMKKSNALKCSKKGV